MSDPGRPPQEAGAGPTRPSADDEVVKARARRAGGGVQPVRRRRGKAARTVKREDSRVEQFTGEQRLLILDCWRRSELPATEFGPLVGVTTPTLYAWRRKFEESGPAGLLGRKRGRRGSQLPEPVKRAVLMMKEQHPDWGQDRIHERSRDLASKIEEEFVGRAGFLGDDLFSTRLSLGKARSIFKLMEIRARKGLARLGQPDPSSRRNIGEIARETEGPVRVAQEHIAAAFEQFKAYRERSTQH